MGKQKWKELLSNTKTKIFAELEPKHKIKQRSKRFPGITVSKLIPDKDHPICGRDPDFSTLSFFPRIIDFAEKNIKICQLGFALIKNKIITTL